MTTETMLIHVEAGATFKNVRKLYQSKRLENTKTWKIKM